MVSEYYTAKRTRNLYRGNSSEAFRLSRSKLDLFIDCPRCFYLDRKLGIAQPPGFPFSLNAAVDRLLKKEFDIHRARGTPHPLMKHYGVDAWATISHEECNKVSCWFFWTQTKWVTKTKEVQIPPGIYRYHQISPDAWRPDHLFNEKKKKAIHDYIEREALKNCPKNCV